MHTTSWQYHAQTQLVQVSKPLANPSQLISHNKRRWRGQPASARSDLALVSRPQYPAAYARLKVLPRIQYSDSIQDLDHAELLRLLQGTAPPATTSQPEDQLSSDAALAQLETAVANSVSIVVASVMEDKLPSYQAAQQETEDKSAAHFADDWSWVTARRQKKKRKVLAGFARAIGDGALVATVHDVVVLPELQGLGLGRKLLAKLTTQILHKTGTDDIGLTSDEDRYGFFRRCGFDLDREQSTYMALTTRCDQTSGTERLQANTKLLTLLAS